jgi:small GTP-binding protein
VIDRVRAARGALVAPLDPGPLDAALAAWDEPAAVAVVGHVGVGKSTLLARLGAEPPPATGLGGVTAEVVAHALPGGLIGLDTPGIDAPDRALAELAGVIDRADAVIWVVDGLRPLGHAERTVLAALPAGTPLHVVVSRADLLDPTDLADVVDRVTTLAARWQPASIRAVDARDADVAGLAEVALPSPRRLRKAAFALDRVRDGLRALPPLPDPAGLFARWRDAWAHAVREAERDVAHEIHAGLVGDTPTALRHLARHLGRRRDALLDALHADPDAAVLLAGSEPDLPAPRVPHVDPWRALLAGLGGGAAAVRAVREECARVLSEGEVSLATWCPVIDNARIEAERDARDRLATAVA